MRFIKPSKDFYNKLMSLWFRFNSEVGHKQLSFEEFLAGFKFSWQFEYNEG
jgi:hypothetical protein